MQVMADILAFMQIQTAPDETPRIISYLSVGTLITDDHIVHYRPLSFDTPYHVV